MECKKDQNRKQCTCTYPSCHRKGFCCECLQYHLAMRQLPGCCFPADAEATYDRSFEAFARAWNLQPTYPRKGEGPFPWGQDMSDMPTGQD